MVKSHLLYRLSYRTTRLASPTEVRFYILSRVTASGQFFSNKKLHADVGSDVLRVRVKRYLFETEFSIEWDSGDLFRIGLENDSAAVATASELDACFHKFVAETATSKVWIDRHLRQLESVVFIRDHRHGTRDIFSDEDEENLAAGRDDYLVRVIKHLMIVIFYAVGFFDPLVIQIRKLFRVLWIEFDDRDFSHKIN